MPRSVKTQSLDIQTQDGVCDACLAFPDDAASYPAVLFYMDAFGPRDVLYEMIKTLASHGYVVLLPNMFYRTRKAPVVDFKFPARAEDMPELRKQIMPLFQSFKPELGLRDAAAFLDFLSTHPRVRAGKMGLTGYCMGGSLALRTAAQFPERVGAAASFHGGNLASDKPDSPHLLLGRVKAELYFAHADNDASMPPEQVERLRAALEQAGIRHEIELYRGAAHGFTMADLPAYDAPSLRRHWEKLLSLFQRTL